jgi:hypothetical protein
MDAGDIGRYDGLGKRYDAIAPKSGALTPARQIIKIPSPVAMAFVREDKASE